MSEIRHDALFDELVIIAPERLHRPMELECTPKPSLPKHCPFCPGNEAMTPPTIYAFMAPKGWKTRVFANRYKALALEQPYHSEEVGIEEVWGGFGAHEVIVDTPRHLRSVWQMDAQEIFAWLATLRQRVVDLRKDRRLVQIEIFKNQGPKAAATIEHPHTQLLALPFSSIFKRRLYQRLHSYYLDHGRPLLHDLPKKELILSQNDQALAFIPYASHFPFETIVASRRHASIASCSDTDLKEWSELLSALFHANANALGECDCNILFYLPPMNRNFDNEGFYEDIDQFFRFFIRIVPRIYTIGGFELQSAIFINPVAPETAKELLGGENA